MNELYWITRLDGLLVIIVFITLGAIIVSLLGFLNCLNYNKSDEEYKTGKKAMNIGITVTFICSCILIFVPTTDEMLRIYGDGGTIDYIKSNDKAMKLPDKCIDALDKYLDNINEDKQKKEK